MINRRISTTQSINFCIGPVILAGLLMGMPVRPSSAQTATQPTTRADNMKVYTYKKTPQAELKTHVYFPAGWSADDQRPAVVFFFGGGWRHGSVHQFESQAQYFAGKGMVTVLADYRVEDRHGASPDQCVEDARSAVRWVRANAARLGIDPDRIAAAGGSAGGHLAACTALTDGPDAPGEDLSVSCRPNALVLFNPVLNMTHPRIAKRLGGDSALARKISPQHHLRKGGPPTLILFGTADPLAAQAKPYMDRARELGNKVELFTAEGAKHGFFNSKPWYERTLHRMEEFLTERGYLPVDAPVQKWARHYYDRVALFRRENEAARGDDASARNIVLVGSSHVEGFNAEKLLPGRRVVNRGISSDRIGIGHRGILRRLDCSVFDCNPAIVILENGANDLGELWRHGTPSIDEIDECYRKVVREIRTRRPDVPLIIVALFPTRDKYAPLVPYIVEFNRRLAAIAKEHGCQFMDVYAPFADDEGLLRKEFSREGLHLTDAGYRQWARMIEEALSSTRPAP
jgi:acetyl esterase/lipase/lysophospholipase L1-like esterase